ATSRTPKKTMGPNFGNSFGGLTETLAASCGPAFCAAISLNTGDSSTEERTNRPTITNTIDNKNGTRQPHSRNASPGAIQFMSAKTAEASNMPVGTPI